MNLRLKDRLRLPFPAHQVRAFLEDIRNLPRFVHTIQKISGRTDDFQGTLRFRGRDQAFAGKRSNKSTAESLVYLVLAQGDKGPTTLRITYTLTATPKGCRVAEEVWMDPPVPFWVWFLVTWLHKFGRSTSPPNLQRLKEEMLADQDAGLLP